MYGKIENGRFMPAPSCISIGGMQVANPSDGQLKSAGYLPVETSDPPVADGMQAVPHYTEQDGKIVQTWTLEAIKATKEEQTISLARALAAAATGLTDTVALSIPDLLPTWAELLAAGEPIQPGVCLMHNGQCYRQAQASAVTPQAHQPPGGEGMLAVYRPIDREHAGTLSDPIPWVYGMDCYQGKYYAHGGITYLCKSDMLPCVWEPGSAGLWQWEAVN